MDKLLISTEMGRLLKLTVDDKRIPVAKRTAMGDPVLKIEGDKISKVIKLKIKEETEE
jgi:DNA gyrase subunit A